MASTYLTLALTAVAYSHIYFRRGESWHILNKPVVPTVTSLPVCHLPSLSIGSFEIHLSSPKIKARVCGCIEGRSEIIFGWTNPLTCVVRQSFPIMLLISALSTVGGEQLRPTAQSDTATSASREFFGTCHAWHQRKSDMTRGERRWTVLHIFCSSQTSLLIKKLYVTSTPERGALPYKTRRLIHTLSPCMSP